MSEVLPTVRAMLCGYFEEPTPPSASVTFLGTQKFSVLRFGPDADDVLTYATLGCSAEPMQDPNELVMSEAGPRAELVMNIRGGADGVARTLAVLAAAPAVEGVILQSGALMSLGEPLWPGSRFTGAVLTDSDVPDVQLEGGQAVSILEVLPATKNEIAFARAKGVEALLDEWDADAIDLTDPLRPAANL